MLKRADAGVGKGMVITMSFVVIVEPNKEKSDVFTDFLNASKMQFAFEIVHSPEKAVELLEQREVDVLVSEIEMDIISGKELFTLTEMLSPNTVRVAISGNTSIRDVISFMNECKTYKVIIVPCKVASDVLEPVEAAIKYKRMRDKLREEESGSENKLFVSEQDSQIMQQTLQENRMHYRDVLDIIKSLLQNNLEQSLKSPESSRKLLQWYEWVTDEYYGQIIAGSGDYDACRKILADKFLSEKQMHNFYLQKKDEVTITPDKMNEISFLITIMANACKLLLPKYRIAVSLEKAEKYYIIRFSCSYAESADENGRICFVTEDREYREQLIQASKMVIGLFKVKNAVLEKEKKMIINIAIPV